MSHNPLLLLSVENAIDIGSAHRDHGVAAQTIERDLANEQIDIETEYRRELERIQSRFLESAQEAERRNDAQGFLEAMRQT